ncbi:hypothetical protein ALNOE001_06620 [Candidatus Methanobinarius endosymbioticus]|uniref:Fibronectin type-III domain-containing protein n=1 Tax=Candidatus Methanobinarius endosymbioticus TaxID=2006182 RepID=A0A366MC62_9EURY|nr:hypothetical protein ALNOE001_06620 [Candidatus Methanobinarius endosymbioticus]
MEIKIIKFTDTGLNSLRSNQYIVKSYLKVQKKTYYGPFSLIITGITKTTTPNMKLISKNKKVAVSWKKVPKATTYQVYKSKSKNGKYSLKKTVKSKSKPIFIENCVKKENIIIKYVLMV